MSALQSYVDQQNRRNAIFNDEQFEIQTTKGRQRVAAMIDSDLSPENLSCDGELSRSIIQVRYRALKAAAKELIKLDPSVKIYEFY
jgi:hypothetical protein